MPSSLASPSGKVRRDDGGDSLLGLVKGDVVVGTDVGARFGVGGVGVEVNGVGELEEVSEVEGVGGG